jgi:Sugar (pentulose and hexulose) kinases
MNISAIKQAIEQGKTALGIELGSTRIKAVLIDENHVPIASGDHTWENQFENGMWTYSLDSVWTGLQAAFRALSEKVLETYGITLKKVGSAGISAMMHGYLVFDKSGNQLVPFRTWRNTTTEQSAALLTERFQFNIPQRWSIAHLYQAILNEEPHVKDIAFMTTLAGYVHWKLTGEKNLGIGDVSGVFPIDSEINDYHGKMLSSFDEILKENKFEWSLNDILPKVLTAGENAGALTAEGTSLLDPAGNLEAGIPLCPPEGDAGTGMTATNSVAVHTGNISAGTSIFAMLVLEKELSKVYMEIDMVTTPAGKPVAMVHCNNCTSDFDAWIRLFEEMLTTMGAIPDKNKLYEALYSAALNGDSDCGGLLAYNYYSGEPITGLDEGRPLLVRMPDSRFTLPNLARTLLFSAMATLKLGMDILTEKEKVQLHKLMGHGGLFKTTNAGQRLMAAALGTSVAVMESAGEGGAWGIALLAAYMQKKKPEQTLDDYLEQEVFAGNAGSSAAPDENDRKDFELFIEKYVSGLAVERAAVEHLR